MEQPAADGLAGAALEQHVVGQHDGRTAVDFQQRADVLQKAELPVAGGGPEVGAFHRQALPLSPAFLVDEGQRGCAAERRIGQHHVVVDAGRRAQAVIHFDVGAVAADAVEIQVHHTEPRRAIDNLPAVQRVVAQMLQLLPVHGRVMLDDVVVGGQQEPAGTAGRVADGHIRPGPHHIDDGLDQGTRREVLPGAGLHVLGVALQQ